MTQTTNLKIELVSQSQAQKELTINEAISRIDAIINRGVEDKDLATPPISPTEGVAYIVAATATGDWLSKEKQIAYYNSGWKFIVPNEGLSVWVNDENKVYYYDGSSWNSYADNFQNLSKLGINATADTTNKLAVASDAVLFNGGSGGDIDVKINKATTSDVAQILMQNNYSGRAKIGLQGDDDLKITVSADGSTWNNAISIDKSSGNVSVVGKLGVGGGTQVSKILTTTAALDFPSISANSSADLTISLTGVVAGDGSTVELGLPSSPTAGIIYMGWASATDTITIRAFNVTSGAINPSSQTFRVTVFVI